MAGQTVDATTGSADFMSTQSDNISLLLISEATIQAVVVIRYQCHRHSERVSM